MDSKPQLKKLGKAIKKIRKKKGYTQSELSALLDKDQQSIQRVEVGRINPSYLYLLEIAEGLDIKLSSLLKSIDK